MIGNRLNERQEDYTNPPAAATTSLCRPSTTSPSLCVTQPTQITTNATTHHNSDQEVEPVRWPVVIVFAFPNLHSSFMPRATIILHTVDIEVWDTARERDGERDQSGRNNPTIQPTDQTQKRWID